MNCLIILAVFISSINYSWAYTCLDDDGNSVDWFIALKLPRGSQYIYMSPKVKTWKASIKGINNIHDGFFYRTMSQVYQNLKDNKSLHLMYNDVPPPTTNAEDEDLSEDYANLNFFESIKQDLTKFGHMKGVVSFKRNQTGFWIVHSAPKNPGKYKFIYHKNALVYGQSFFCSTFNYDALGKITEQILIGIPKVFQCKISPEIQKDFPKVQGLCKQLPTSIKQRSVALKPNFYHICKSYEFGDDLYSGLVAPKFKRSLYVESWRSNLNSNCSTSYKVHDIRNIQAPGAQFKSTDDHSKWAVSTDGSVVCIGDINRTRAQFKRGGGTMCIADRDVGASFLSLVKNHTQCGKPREEWFYWNDLL